MSPSLSSVLLRRLRTVYVGEAGPRPGDPPTTTGLVALEAELLDRGFALTPALHAALAWLGPAGLADAGKRLVGHIDAELGADRTHMPLFRSFPASVPDDTLQLYVDRVFTLLLQWPHQPCVLCSTVGSVHPVAPCAHLVCRECWDGADYSGCPICHRRTAGDDPFLRPAPPHRRVETAAGPVQPLTLGTDAAADAVTALGRLLARRTPLPPQDRDDVVALLAHTPAGLGWLPAEIPVRETKALVLGTLLRDRRTRDAVRAVLPARLTTATDVLRLLAVWSGGGADLLDTPRHRSLPRGLRRELLAVLDGLDPSALVEDVLRHPERWKRAAETLHPNEQHARHPRAALAFAVLRATHVSTVSEPLAATLVRTAAENPLAVRADGALFKANTWTGRVEQAFAARESGTVIALLAQRPGTLLRRLDQVLRLEGDGTLPDALASVLEHGLAGAGPGPLLAALGRLRIRDVPGGRRVFFPRGRVTHSYTLDDTRPPLPAPTVERVCALLEREVLRRLSTASRFDLAVLDEGLAALAVPSAESAAAKALVAVPRGSTQPLPEGEVLRMFLHWMQPPAETVDLDLSVAFFDAEWTYLGLCDFTNLVYRNRVAVHSGDLTSAPAPTGASEYADLDLDGLTRAGVRFAMPVVFSYNNVPFELLPDAFAGFMALPSVDGRVAHFDPRTVRQRYDLIGHSRVHVPMVVDVERRTFLWTDLHMPPSEGYHSVGRHIDELGRAGRDLHQYFSAGRTTLWDLAVWHAAARTDEVAVSRRHGLVRYRRGAGEDTAAFADRIRTLRTPDAEEPHGTESGDGVAAVERAAAGKRVLLASVNGDAAPEKVSGTVYRLLPGPVDGCGLDRVAAGDLVAALG
ncbi:MXAN_6230/SCO0854 family RING domain-containing protein [Streptomyces sp. st77]|uniref:MXAN_6230/SCO0854 family RING domain-containing protein n=1 Tax=Streptomyces sp. st77 TaxID=1828074 RepID=UPI000BFDB376|nr:MXAN_6230/SCO0854 family RING domain-containing protein [Streptomyces sp. st77]